MTVAGAEAEHLIQFEMDAIWVEQWP